MNRSLKKHFEEVDGDLRFRVWRTAREPLENHYAKRRHRENKEENERNGTKKKKPQGERE